MEIQHLSGVTLYVFAIRSDPKVVNALLQRTFRGTGSTVSAIGDEVSAVHISVDKCEVNDRSFGQYSCAGLWVPVMVETALYPSTPTLWAGHQLTDSARALQVRQASRRAQLGMPSGPGGVERLTADVREVNRSHARLRQWDVRRATSSRRPGASSSKLRGRPRRLAEAPAPADLVDVRNGRLETRHIGIQRVHDGGEFQEDFEFSATERISAELGLLPGANPVLSARWIRCDLAISPHSCRSPERRRDLRERRAAG